MPDAFAGIEIVRPAAPRGRVRFALFDFDGTLSLIREGWQGVMIPYFVEEMLACPRAEAREEVERVVRDFVERLTGKQTVYQCIQLAEEVSARGGPPREPLEYKHEYLRRLWERIAHRVEGLKSGAIDPETMLVRGSRALLDALAERDATMYVASGTDHPYVVDEAAALRIDGYFGPRIYGALDDYRSISKQIIIERILREHDLHGANLAVIGDGYVEIENAKSVGGLAIGVASDEANPGGLDEWKRRRLIAAGADAIVRDYAELPSLLRYLFGSGA
ncbi:MAG TPA: HAD family hydrolase [Chthonomonadales bacterium]|nr:HAD family hydrolase [Chthonomonadales bacterium]